MRGHRRFRCAGVSCFRVDGTGGSSTLVHLVGFDHLAGGPSPSPASGVGAIGVVGAEVSSEISHPASTMASSNVHRWFLKYMVFLFVVPAGCDSIAGIGKDEGVELWVANSGVVLEPGESYQASAVFHGAEGSPIGGPRFAHWWSDHDGVVSVTGSGRVSAVAPGEATLELRADGSTASALVRVRSPAQEPTHRWRSVSSYATTTCAVDLDGAAHCWGSDYQGELGSGGRREQWRHHHAPVPVASSEDFTEVSAGLLFACGLTDGGEVLCWGIHNGSRLGHGETGTRFETAPVAVKYGGRAVTVVTGAQHSCLLDADGATYCWGSNLSKQLGIESSAASTADLGGGVARVDFELPFVDIAAGGYHTCGITADSELYCWGGIPAGSGLASTTAPTPMRIPTPDEPVAVFAGDGLTCYLNDGGEARCWGDNSLGQVGAPPNEGYAEPHPVSGGHSFQELAVGGSSTCGLTMGGAMYCWGAWSGLRAGPHTEDCGIVGDPRPCSGTPMIVASGQPFRAITNQAATCGVTLAGGMMCWNDNDWGQAGIGRIDRDVVFEPQRVRDPFPANGWH